MELEDVRMIGDLQEYLRNHPSPVVADILQQIIRYFAKDCRKEDGRKDWKAIEERKGMGLRFQLKPDTVIDANVVHAFFLWLSHPKYGRNLGESFLEAMTSQAIGQISNPRQEVQRILDFLLKR